MPNHFHLLLEMQTVSPGRLMQALLTGYARRFNRVHQRRGQVFQGRYTALVCERDRSLGALVRSLHLHPVRAGLATRPREWPGMRRGMSG
ncbi:MAG: transposase [Deltaproteobacteria bacterium]|nr:transposase [Deltaproteobacteria bacterium]